MTAPFRFFRSEFRASHAEADAALLQLRGLLEGLEARDRFAVELLAREALSNAVRHGCKEDEALGVRFQCRLGRASVVLRIADEGPGFAWRTRLDAPPDDEASDGRGLALFRLYADRMYFNPCGNRLLLIRKLPEPTMPEQEPVQDSILHPGDLTAATVEQVRVKLKALLQGGARQLTIDLAGVQMVDSMGIGLLIQANNSLAKLGGGLVVRNASPDLVDLFRSMRLDKRFTLQA